MAKLSAAEKQRRYRERRKNDPVKEAENERKDSERRKASRKSIKDKRKGGIRDLYGKRIKASLEPIKI